MTIIQMTTERQRRIRDALHNALNRDNAVVTQGVTASGYGSMLRSTRSIKALREQLLRKREPDVTNIPITD